MKPILRTISHKWPEYLLEMVVITAGVLGAFALNNWNEDRKETNEEAKIIVNLNAEFRSNGKILNNSMARLERVIHGLDSILGLLSQEDQQVSTHDFEELLGTTFSNPNWTPGSFVLDDIKNSGGLSRLKDDSLKHMLLEWERLYVAVIDVEEGYKDYSEQYIEYLSIHGSARNLDALSGTISGLQKSIIATNDPAKFLNDPLFENRVDNFYFLAVQLRTIYVTTSEKLHRIIERTN